MSKKHCCLQFQGLEIRGTFTVQGGVINADLTFTNKAMQDFSDFAIQFNKNSFGLVPAGPLNVTRLMPQQSLDVKLPIQKGGAILKMDPLNNLQVKFCLSDSRRMTARFWRLNVSLLLFTALWGR